MKTIKIILGIITFFVLLFLATGLIVKEVHYSVEIEIDRPIEEVFTVFIKPETLKKWLPEVKSLEPIEVKEGKVGSTYKMIVDNGGEDLMMIEKIIAYIPNQKITFQFDSTQMIKTDDYNFVANESKTIITQNCTVNSKSYITACLFPYFKGTFTEASQKYMDRFKVFVEKNKE